MDKHVWSARTKHTEKPRRQWWASLDGQSYLPVSRKPTDADYDAIYALFNPPGSFTPMRYARRCLGWKDISMGVEFFD